MARTPLARDDWEATLGPRRAEFVEGQSAARMFSLVPTSALESYDRPPSQRRGHPPFKEDCFASVDLVAEMIEVLEKAINFPLASALLELSSDLITQRFSIDTIVLRHTATLAGDSGRVAFSVAAWARDTQPEPLT